MKKVIISSNHGNLARFLQSDKEQYFYLSPILCDADIEGFLEEEGHKKIDISEGLDIDFRQEYIDFIGRLNRDYCSINWWSTTISHKGTFVSNLQTDIFNFYCIVSLIKKRNRNYIIISNKPLLNHYIKRYCGDNQLQCILADKEKRSGRFAHYRKSFLSDVYFLYHGWTRKLLAYLYFSKNVKKLLKQRKSYYIIRSYVDERSFTGPVTYKDVYFGGLAEYLKQKGKDFIILTGILTNYKELVWKLKGIKQYPIIPQEYFVGYLDFIKAVIFTFINRIRVAGPVFFCGIDVTDFLKEGLKKDYEINEIENNFMYFYYIKGLLKKINTNTFAFTLENQAWERMSILALRKYSPATKIIGYVHSSIIQSQLSYFFSKEEENVMPLPDKIITMGKEPWFILNSSTNYADRAKLVEGCALRFEYLFEKDKVLWNKNGKILVALSWDYSRCLNLLRFLLAAFAQKDSPEVILRSHPLLPVELLMKQYNIKLNNNFYISKKLEFEHDLSDSSLLIYADTTCCMEALACGVPVVCIDFKEAASPDPLFDIDSLKWTAYNKSDLHNVLDEIYRMDNNEYMKKYNNAKAYLVRYFHPIKEKYLQEFIT